MNEEKRRNVNGSPVVASETSLDPDSGNLRAEVAMEFDEIKEARISDFNDEVADLSNKAKSEFAANLESQSFEKLDSVAQGLRAKFENEIAEIKKAQLSGFEADISAASKKEMEAFTATLRSEAGEKLELVVSGLRVDFSNEIAKLRNRVETGFSAGEKISDVLNTKIQNVTDEIVPVLENFVGPRIEALDNKFEGHLQDGALRFDRFEQAFGERQSKLDNECSVVAGDVRKFNQTLIETKSNLKEELQQRTSRQRHVQNWALGIAGVFSAIFLWYMAELKSAKSEYSNLIKNMEASEEQLERQQEVSSDIHFYEAVENLVEAVTHSPTSMGKGKSKEIITELQRHLELVETYEVDSPRVNELRDVGDAAVRFHELVSDSALEQLFADNENIADQLLNIAPEPFGRQFKSFGPEERQQFRDFFVFANGLGWLLKSGKTDLSALKVAASSFKRVSDESPELYARSALNFAICANYKLDATRATGNLSDNQLKRLQRQVINAFEKSVARSVGGTMKSVSLNNLADKWIHFVRDDEQNAAEYYEKAERLLERALMLPDCHPVVFVTYAECIAAKVAKNGLEAYEKSDLDRMYQKIIELLTRAKANEFDFRAVNATELMIDSPSFQILEEMAPQKWEQEIKQVLESTY
jgi:tetratricopeptide (TPR) repeat protein